jgi:SAM-dependent methyltransferase
VAQPGDAKEWRGHDILTDVPSEQDHGPGVTQTATYTYGHSPTVVGVHAARTASREAAFFLPYLAPGMRLLDAGCGPGTITLGLARAVAPGETVGIDVERSVVERAQALASEQRLPNVRFEVGNALRLPFEDQSFDAVFAHTLLEHLSDPIAALHEARRVLRPGGMIGLRDCDWGSGVFWPPDPAVQRAMDLYERVWQHNGGQPYCGRQFRALLREAGFTRIETSASFRWDGSNDGSPNSSRAFGELLSQRLLLPNLAEPILANGWADETTLQQISRACANWSQHPDAFAAMTMVEAVAWQARQ